MKLTVTVLVLCLSFLAVQAGRRNVCRVKGRGQLFQFNQEKVFINLPCKFRAVDFKCGDLHVSLLPGMALDKRAFYYTRTMWVTIRKDGTDSVWKGRTSDKRVIRYFNDTTGEMTAFNVKTSYMEPGQNFQVVTRGYKQASNVVLKVQGSSLKIKFFPYIEDDRRLRVQSGVQLVCRDSEFADESVYPQALCGLSNDTEYMQLRRHSLGLQTVRQTIMYDMLNTDDITHTNPQCDAATREFKTCSNTQRSTAIKECSNIMTDAVLMRCFKSKYLDPMNIFVYCLAYKCSNDSDSCFLLKEALTLCPSSGVLAEGEQCPTTQP